MYELPNNEESENAVLGSMLTDRRCAEYINKLTVDDFYNPRNQKIFVCMQELYKEDKPIDMTTLMEKVKSKKYNYGETIGYISMLTDAAFTANFKHYFKTIKKASFKRKTYTILQDLSEKLLQPDFDTTAVDLKNNILQEISDISIQESQTTDDSIKSVMLEALLGLESKYNNRNDTSYYVGFTDLDKAIAGLHSEELTLIASRPAVGKTAFGLQIAENIASNGKHVYVITREMSNKQLAMRMISRHARVDSHKLRLGSFDLDKEWMEIVNATNRLSKLNMTLDSKSGTIQEIRARARELKRTVGLGLIVVDYIQLLQTGKKTNTRHEEVASMSRDLKLMTLEFGIPIIALAQLNREADIAKRPQLGHLGESSSLEKDADNVIFLHKDNESKAIENDLEVEEVDIIVAKQRNGPTGIIKLGYRPKTMTFMNLYRG